LLTPRPTPGQAVGLPLVGCPRLLIQCIRSYPPHPEAVSSIRNLRTRQAVVTWTQQCKLKVNFMKYKTLLNVNIRYKDSIPRPDAVKTCRYM